jgi:hypothetical protein
LNESEAGRGAAPRLLRRIRRCDEVLRQARTINIAPVIQRHSLTARAVGFQHGEYGAETRGRAAISNKPLSVIPAASLALRAKDFYHGGTLCDIAEQDVMAGHALLRRHQCFLIPAAMRRTAAASPLPSLTTPSQHNAFRQEATAIPARTCTGSSAPGNRAASAGPAASPSPAAPLRRGSVSANG